MAAVQGDGNEEQIQEIMANHNGQGGSVVDFTTDANDDEVQEMEVETENDQQTANQAENEGTQPVNDENTVPDDTEMQSSVQNMTPVVNRSVQVMQESSAVISPDDFQCKPSKPPKTKPSKIAKSPLKSPDRDDDVSLASSFHHFVGCVSMLCGLYTVYQFDNIN